MRSSGIEDDRLPPALKVDDEPYQREQSHRGRYSGKPWKQHALRIQDIAPLVCLAEALTNNDIGLRKRGGPSLGTGRRNAAWRGEYTHGGDISRTDGDEEGWTGGPPHC